MFIPIQQASKLFETKVKNLQNLYYIDVKHGRFDRFKKIDGVLHVEKNFKALYADELESLWFQALEIESCEKSLSRIIASKLNKPVNTVYMYIRNFKFKNELKAKEIISVLRAFIQSHPSLFEVA